MKSVYQKLTVLAAAAVLTVGLAGCGSNGSGGSASPTALTTEPVTLSLYWWGNDARQQNTQKVIDLFEQKYPNITIQPQFADWTSYWDKLATMTAGGNTPDIMQMDMMYISSYANNGVLAQLDTNPVIDTTGMPASVLGTGQVGGKLYGMPITTTSQALIVNTTILDQLGIKLPDTSTWTWDDFNTWAASITQASGGTIYGTYPMYIEYQLELFARQLGDQVFSPSGDLVIKPETLAKFFQTSLDWQTSGATPPASRVAETINVPINQSDFGTGHEASVWGSSTQITSFQAAVAGSTMAVVPLPSFSNSPSGWEYLKPGMYWSMSAKCQHPAEAAEFINFFNNDPAAGAILGTERGIPASTAVMSSISSSLSATDQLAANFGASLSLGDAPAMPPAGSSDIQTMIQRYLSQVLAGQSTPIDAANAMIAELKDAIQAAK